MRTRHRFHYEEKETIATLLCAPQYRRIGERALHRCRETLEAYLKVDPPFGKALTPYPVSEASPAIVRTMAEAAQKVGVGPMASVAGAFAGEAVKAIMAAGADEAIVDNGGDIALLVEEPLTVGIYAGQSPIKDLAFLIEPREGVWGICTSSGTVGPSLSFGKADAAIVIAADPALADAAATALGNRVRDQKDLTTCFDFLESIPGIEGAVVIFRDQMALWGDLPRLVRMEVDESLITAGRQLARTQPFR